MALEAEDTGSVGRLVDAAQNPLRILDRQDLLPAASEAPAAEAVRASDIPRSLPRTPGTTPVPTEQQRSVPTAAPSVGARETTRAQSPGLPDR